MGLFESLFVWANLPYAIVFTVAIVFALLQMTGLLGLLAGGGDHDADGDADGDADHDVDHDVDHDADADHDADQDAETAHENAGNIGDRILVDLGVGRVPFSILWQSFALSFGLAGLALNTLVLGPGGALTAFSLLYTLPASLFAAWFLTRMASRLLGKVVGAADKEATSRHGLIGSSGVVISSRITSEFGEIRVKDPAGNFVHLICRIRSGEAPIASGAEVVIVDCETSTGHIFVAPLDADFSPSPKDTGNNRKRIGAADAVASEAEAEAEAALLAEQSEKREKTRSN